MRSFSLAHLTLFTCANFLLYLSAGVMADAEELLNDFVQFGKEFLEKALTQWRLPQLVNNGNGQLSFQVDPTNNLEAPCASCRLGVPRETLAGTWSIVMISRNLMSSKFAELDRVLGRLERNQPVSAQRTFMEWISGAPDLRCAQLAVLDSAGAAKYEIGYRLAATGRQRSVIGNWNRDETGTYTWELPAQIGTIRLCISHHGYLGGDTMAPNYPRTAVWPSSETSLPSNSIPINTGGTTYQVDQQQMGQHETPEHTTAEPVATTPAIGSDRSATNPSFRPELQGATGVLSIATNSSQSQRSDKNGDAMKAGGENELSDGSPTPNSTANVTSCPEVVEKIKTTAAYGKIVGVGTVTEAESDGHLQIRQNATNTVTSVLHQTTTPPDTVATVKNATDGDENATVHLSSEITKTRLGGHRKCANRTKGTPRRKQRMALPLSQPLASPLLIRPAVRWPPSQPLDQPRTQLSIDGLSRNTVDVASGLGPLTSRILPESLAGAGADPTVAAMTQFLVLNQVDSSPMPCDNYIVLARLTTPRDSDQTLAKIAQIREFLERERVESVFNKLERIHCY